MDAVYAVKTPMNPVLFQIAAMQNAMVDQQRKAAEAAKEASKVAETDPGVARLDQGRQVDFYV
ncbi:MAG: hypothetical protein ACKO91_07365 [Acidimicrobiales bacterium]